ncbi:deazapurine DNA modification protein DpdA family protein [Lentzea pudingi]|uniref:deazapurine DNA modification protein DpdA family protein n=1 Tax=Lentzea pudingi TaxID=1789439 RepID=UPI001E3C1152|nr:hypothetical protein [Lentzea pudingi]
MAKVLNNFRDLDALRIDHEPRHSNVAAAYDGTHPRKNQPCRPHKRRCCLIVLHEDVFNLRARATTQAHGPALVRSTHHRCADSYERHGVELASLPVVGVGSVCRRQHTDEVEQILRSQAARGYRLHAFGAKVLGLARYADAIHSSNSLAWSLRGRHVPGCTPSHRSESNCLRFALQWHTRLVTSLPVNTCDTTPGRKPSSTRPPRTARHNAA